MSGSDGPRPRATPSFIIACNHLPDAYLATHRRRCRDVAPHQTPRTFSRQVTTSRYRTGLAFGPSERGYSTVDDWRLSARGRNSPTFPRARPPPLTIYSILRAVRYGAHFIAVFILRQWTIVCEISWRTPVLIGQNDCPNLDGIGNLGRVSV